MTEVTQVIRALVRYPDVFDPRSGSLIRLSGTTGRVRAEPFRGGLLATLEERRELVRRLQRLDPRKRHLLYLWYSLGTPVTEIARQLNISRMHCYRLRLQALEDMTKPFSSDASTATAPPA